MYEGNEFSGYPERLNAIVKEINTFQGDGFADSVSQEVSALATVLKRM